MGQKALAKYEAARKAAKTAAKAAIEKSGKGDKKNDAFANKANDALEIGSHAFLAVASQQVPDGMFGVSELRPDTMAAIGGGIGVLALKGGWQKRSYAIAKGGVHACITRWVNGRLHIHKDANGNVSVDQGR